jgi:acylpyruvate hydrolase
VKLVTIAGVPQGRTGLLLGEEVLDFTLARDILPLAWYVPSSMPELLAGGPQGLDFLRRLSDAAMARQDDLRQTAALRPLSEVRLAPPVPRPGILLSHGRAYHSHAREMAGGGKPRVEEQPSAFMKNVNSIIASGEPIVLPPQFPDMVDFEGEFSIVFGAVCHNIAAGDALRHVAGYTIINDVSARNWVPHFTATNNPDLNRMGKQLPGFTPLGPVIVTADEIPDPHDVTLTTRLNGEVMQDAHTSDLIWRIPELIAFFAQWYRFGPGDILTTGSPAGVGYARTPKLFMKPGDTVAITVDKVGTLINPIRAA